LQHISSAVVDPSVVGLSCKCHGRMRERT
jgi:hypothetical protein